ncbi:MAG: extracellular solute-binding protein [Thermoprotei archaeon]
MGKENEKNKVDPDRRQFLVTVGSAIVALGLGYAIGYLSKPAEVIEKTITKTVTTTKTVTKTPSPTPSPTPPSPTTSPIPGLSDVAARAIQGIRDLINRGVVPPGTTLRILHVTGSRAQLEKAKELWEKYVPEVKIELVTQGTEPDVYTKAMEEAVTKAGTFDIATIFSTWLGDAVESGLARQLDDYFNKYDPGYTGPCAPIEPLGSYTTLYKGKRYALTLDSDVFTLTYRKDLIENPTYKDEFRAQYGYDLKVPDTWEEVIDIAEFFTNLNLTSPRGGKVWGAYFYAEPAFAAYITWTNIFFEAGGILFDPNTMDPRIDSPEGRYAFDIMLRLKPYMPPEAISASWADLYDKYIHGESVLTAAWPSLTKMAISSPDSVVKEVTGTALMPGVEVDIGGTKKLVRAAPNPVNWVGIVNNYSKYPEAAYLFLQFMTAPDIGLEVVLSGVILDLFRKCWFTDPKYRTKAEEGYGKEFVDKYMQSIEISYPDFILRGGPEYADKLTKAVNAVMAGTLDPETALSNVASEWDSITNKYGRDSQLEAWRALMQLFPETIKEVWRAKGYM